MDSLRTSILLGLLTACSALNSWEIPVGNLQDYVNDELTADWFIFKKVYNRTYTDSSEEIKRRVLWEDTRKFIEDHNRQYERGETTYFVGENDFSDMAEDEFKKTYLSGLIVPDPLQNDGPVYEEEMAAAVPELSAPSSKDWRDYRIISPIRNQGSCGSCWAFASIDALESAYAKKYNKKVDLSEQNLVDCATRGNYGCRGGWMSNAYAYIKSQGGVDNESCYRYRARQGRCYFRSNCIGCRISGYKAVSPRTEAKMKEVIGGIGPVAIAVDVSSRGFMSYRGGIFNNPYCSQTPNHAMTSIGYGSERGHDFWIIKNSWGTRFGENGYVRMTRNRRNQCGIASYAVYPIVA